MTQPFEELTGKRVLLTKPVRKESKIELSDESKAALEAEAMKNWTALEVYAIGTEVTKPNLIPGKKVYVPTYAIQSAEILEVDGALRIMITEGEVAIIW
jgi:hypothetical protein